MFGTSLSYELFVHDLLHSKHLKECNSSSTIANYCVTRTIARAIATEDNYCGDTPCGVHPLSELREKLKLPNNQVWELP